VLALPVGSVGSRYPVIYAFRFLYHSFCASFFFFFSLYILVSLFSYCFFCTEYSVTFTFAVISVFAEWRYSDSAARSYPSVSFPHFLLSRIISCIARVCATFIFFMISSFVLSVHSVLVQVYCMFFSIKFQTSCLRLWN
jgi:hypothetical protein